MRRFLLFLFVCLACKSAPSGSGALITQILPYDFAKETPAKITALLKEATDSAEPSAHARYQAARARLDWLLVSWLNDDEILFDKLAQHLGIVGCSHQEKREDCMRDIPAKILQDLGETNVFVPETTGLKSLLSALQLGPHNAAMALGVNSAAKKTGEVGLRAKLAILATTNTTLKELPRVKRNKAIETLAAQSPFMCPDSFLALDPKQSNDIDTTAAYCGFACPSHRNGVLSSEDTTPTLIEKCTIEYYGLSKGQEPFVTKRNFITYRLLQSLSQHLGTSLEAKQDPIFPLVEKSLMAIQPRLEELRFFATLDLDSTGDGLSFSQQPTVYQIDSTPYLVLRGSQLFVALWPTLRSKGGKTAVTEGIYAHPGKLIGSPQDTSLLGKELSDAASVEFSLGPRLPQEELLEPPPAMLPSVTGAPEGTKDLGKPIFLLTTPGTTFGEIFGAGIGATDAGYGKIRLIASIREVTRSTSLSAIELLFARGEDLALVEKSPFGFPGGALVLVLQPGLLRAALPPGLERTPLDKKAIEGLKLTESGFEEEPTQEFFSYFTAKKYIIAVAPGINMKQVADLLDLIKRADPRTEILLSLAPETENPAWLKTLPRATGAAFEASNNFSPVEVNR